MNKKINETVDYIKLIKALMQVTKSVSEILETPVHFAILFGEDSFEEIMFDIEYLNLDHEFSCTVSVTDTYDLITKYGTKRTVQALVKTLMEDSMEEFFKYLNRNY